MTDLVIAIDTREQTPWHFPPEVCKTVLSPLNAGDYAVKGDSKFSIERKSLDDFVGTVSTGWDRFLRELDRMNGFPARVIIVENTYKTIMEHGYSHPQVRPRFVVKRIAQLTMMNVSVLFADDRTMAAGLCYSILKRRWEGLNGIPN